MQLEKNAEKCFLYRAHVLIWSCCHTHFMNFSGVVRKLIPNPTLVIIRTMLHVNMVARLPWVFSSAHSKNNNFCIHWVVSNVFVASEFLKQITWLWPFSDHNTRLPDMISPWLHHTSGKGRMMTLGPVFVPEAFSWSHRLRKGQRGWHPSGWSSLLGHLSSVVTLCEILQQDFLYYFYL